MTTKQPELFSPAVFLNRQDRSERFYRFAIYLGLAEKLLIKIL
jgi:hypothetical protein